MSKHYLVALDLSTKTGLAVFELNKAHPMDAMASKLILYKTVTSDKAKAKLDYPYDYIWKVDTVVNNIMGNINALMCGDDLITVVIEETNGSKSRYTQKMLEFIHYATIKELLKRKDLIDLIYINTSDWRKITGINLTTEQKKQNQALSKAKSQAKKSGNKLDKKKLGIGGKITKKHLAVAKANELFGLKLKQKDNDQADAILLGYAYLLGVPRACPQTK